MSDQTSHEINAVADLIVERDRLANIVTMQQNQIERLLTARDATIVERDVAREACADAVKVLRHSAAVHWALHAAQGSVHDETHEQCKAMADRLESAVKGNP